MKTESPSFARLRVCFFSNCFCEVRFQRDNKSVVTGSKHTFSVQATCIQWPLG